MTSIEIEDKYIDNYQNCSKILKILKILAVCGGPLTFMLCLTDLCQRITKIAMSPPIIQTLINNEGYLFLFNLL